MGKRNHSSQVSDEEATESWNDKNTHVQVTQPQGFMCQVHLVCQQGYHKGRYWSSLPFASDACFTAVCVFMSPGLYVINDLSFWHLQVSLRGKVDLPPDEVFDVLVDVNNHKVFKSIKARRPRSKGACCCARDSTARSCAHLHAPGAAGRSV